MVELAASVRVLIENPFAREPSELRAASDHLARTDVAEVVVRHSSRGDVEEAKRVLLATAHVAAIDDPTDPSRVLGPNVLPGRVASGLPRPRGAYLAVAMAAGRCHRALRAIRGESSAMQRVRRETWAACFGDSLLHALTLQQVIHDHDVLILGETGTGKEAIARAIQEGTPGRDGGDPAPRSALNAAAVPQTLIESELFGHVKGAFTGATDSRVGKIRSAHGGTFFLDEVGDLEGTTQVKLLRVMETDEVFPLGSDQGHETDVRYVAATHKDLGAMVDAGEYRRDFFNRLAGMVLRIPPLRERPEDIPEIGMDFLAKHLPRDALPETRDATRRWLESPEAQRHAWPGNVRELQNALRNLMLGLDAGIGEAGAEATPDGERLPPALMRCVATLEDVQAWYLERVLAHTEHNLARAARVLGVDRSTVRRKARRARRGA